MKAEELANAMARYPVDIAESAHRTVEVLERKSDEAFAEKEHARAMLNYIRMFRDKARETCASPEE